MKPQKVHILLVILFLALSGLKTIAYSKPSTINMAIIICQIILVIIMAIFEQRTWARIGMLCFIGLLIFGTYVRYS